jgi:serine/threonine-protein kinase OSR1/STK39
VIGEDGVIKLTDFGVAARLMEEGQRRQARYTRIGTVCYMAPEVLQEQSGHTEKADIWSLGITAIELATGAAPYAHLHELDIVQKILKAPPPQLPRAGGFSPEFRDFVRKCMNSDPGRRLGAEALIKHPFIEKASESSYIVDYVLKGLPPLGDRYAAMHGSESSIDSLVRRLTNGEDSASMSLPAKIEWTFHDETDAPALKKGRFTIKREPSTPPGRNNPRPPPIPVATTEELTATISRLTAENAQLKQQVTELKDMVAELTRQLRG